MLPRMSCIYALCAMQSGKSEENKYEKFGEEFLPMWKALPAESTGSAHDAGTSPARKRRNIQVKPTEREKYSFKVIN